MKAKAQAPGVLHVDPSGTGYIGVARVTSTGVDLVSVRTLPKSRGTQGRTWSERLRPVLDRLADGVSVLGIELPPRHAKKDTGTANSRGTIGLSIGRVVGMVEAWGYDKRLDVRVEEVQAWHAWRERELLKRRVQVPSVTTNPYDGNECRMRVSAPVSDGKIKQRWACGAERVVAVSSLTRMSSGCPSCGGGKEARAGDERRLQHKVASFCLARELWPSQVEQLVQDAGGRATSAEARQAPWRLAGVVDACEAGIQAAALRESSDVA